MANNYWLDQEKKFLKAIEGVDVPNETLDNVDFVEVNSHNDFSKIPNGGGCYWIWTNEPVIHSLHKNQTPKPFQNGEIIYNGIAKDDVKGRIFHHLYGFEDAGWSGISLDIYTKASSSHRKKACSPKGKVPFINNIPIRSKEELLKLHLTQCEKIFINNSEQNVFHFRNGINLNDEKHKNFLFKVYFITGLTSLYLEHIEKEWRKNGLPKLCSYLTGR
ncbi:MAG TPA: hypothetical protein ENN20_04790 [Candidatus Marinimicrobia bacterium]|nr:hypothetical protein [Candidatus Neomarinimicrobiota bacterium]